jgi:hypothetical protein
VFTRDTFLPYTLNDVNALIGNHYFVQSMLAFDRTPFTVGISNVEARADWARMDGSTFRGSLNRTKYLLSFGVGRPSSGTAVFVVGNMDGIYAGPWPAFFENANEDGHVQATSYGAVGAIGIAHQGWVAQLAYFYHNTQISADATGRFTQCDFSASCAEPSLRSGAPAASVGVGEETSVGNTMLTLENGHGYSAGVLLTPREEATASGNTERKTALGSLRLLAEPYDLLPEAIGVLGAGLTTFGRGLDYYGDQTDAVQQAIAAGEPAPEPSTKGIVEFPFTAQRIAETGATARIVLQASPAPAFRLAEAGYFYEGDPSWRFLPQLGGRAKLFKRASGYVPSADAYAGFFWVFNKDVADSHGRGLSAYAIYSYNSPDAANLVPLANAHILGAQIVFGNPTALPPPSSLIKYPSAVGEAP